MLDGGFGMNGASENVRAQPQEPAIDGQPKPLSRTQARLAEKIARAALVGSTNDEIAAQVGRSERTVRRIRRHPDFAAAVERGRSAIRIEALREGEAGRLEAMRAARRVLRLYADGDAAVEAKDALLGARVILSATQPASDAQRERARAQILAALPGELRAKVLDALDHGEAARLAKMTDEELGALAGDGGRS